MNNNRRNFIKNAALCGSLFAGLPAAIAAGGASQNKSSGAITLNKGDVILFQGDSITDASRNKGAKGPNNKVAFGTGYALLAAASLLATHAGKDLKIYNRGISGNKVPDLAKRWEQDCESLKPNVLSILIGVNDYWHSIGGKHQSTPQSYETGFRALLKQTREALPKTKLILCEPFALNTGKAVNDSWFPIFNEYRAAAKKLAKEFNAVFVPFQSEFDAASKLAPKSYWSTDGVHPTLAGAQLMASAWLRAVK